MIRDIEVIPDRMVAAKIDALFWSMVGHNYKAKKYYRLLKKAKKMDHWRT